MCVGLTFQAQAQTQSQAQTSSGFQRGKILTADAIVYKEADFDSPVLGKMKLGSQLNISKRIFGAFYQVQVGKNRFGYVSDVDVRPLNEVNKAQKIIDKNADSLATSKKGMSEQQRKEILEKRPFDSSDFQGFEIAMIRFRESTMGLRPSDNRLFFGFTASGPRIVMEGLSTDLNVLISPGAPSYYEQATGKSADGFILITDFKFQTVTSRGKDIITYVGFGPMFRYSRFGVTFTNGTTGKDESYSLEDMAIGAVFDLGLGMRFGRFAAKVEAQYYWERLQYWGFAASGQMAF